MHHPKDSTTRLSIVIPCFNEERTLEACVHRVLGIADQNLALEVIIVDDHSNDDSYRVAKEIQQRYPDIKVVRHQKNSGKGAALRTGFRLATGEFVAVQDADLEYDPEDLKRLIVPLANGTADAVLGSRFLSAGVHRVLYFWHYMGNRLLTFLSNMFTDLNLSDMETCYKVFRRDVIQSIAIEEDRFGFEPEIVAKIAHMRLRIYEMGISYYGRTYEEGKKIGLKDGLRALYCILRYNAPSAPVPARIIIDLGIGGIAAAVNILTFWAMYASVAAIAVAAPAAFIPAALVNDRLFIKLFYRNNVNWKSAAAKTGYWIMMVLIGLLDLGVTQFLVKADWSPWSAKCMAAVLIFSLNFFGRWFIAPPEPTVGPWQPTDSSKSEIGPHFP